MLRAAMLVKNVYAESVFSSLTHVFLTRLLSSSAESFKSS